MDCYQAFINELPYFNAIGFRRQVYFTTRQCHVKGKKPVITRFFWRAGAANVSSSSSPKHVLPHIITEMYRRSWLKAYIAFAGLLTVTILENLIPWSEIYRVLNGIDPVLSRQSFPQR